LIGECLKEFIQLISSQANEICDKEKKTTITPNHILLALSELDLPTYKDIAEEEWKIAEAESKAQPRRKKRKLEDSNKSMSELQAKQQQLFAQAKARRQQQKTPET